MAHVFFDFDSTVITKETLDEAITRALSGHPERSQLMREVEAITQRGMEGDLDFTESVNKRLKIIPLSRTLLQETGCVMKQHITPGIAEVFTWLKESGHDAYIVSGGFEECVLPVAEVLGVPRERLLTNKAVFTDDGLLAKADENALLWTNEGKTPALRAIRKRVGKTLKFVMVGDGMNDYRAFESGAADIFCGFGANIRREPIASKATDFFDSASAMLEFFKKTL